MKKTTSVTSPNKITYKQSPMMAKFGPQEVIMSSNSIKNFQSSEQLQKNTLFQGWKNKNRNPVEKVTLAQKTISDSIKGKRQQTAHIKPRSPQPKDIQYHPDNIEELLPNNYEIMSRIVSNQDHNHLINHPQYHQNQQKYQPDYQERYGQNNTHLQQRQYTFGNGDVYIGTWNVNKIQGYGVYTFNRQNMQYRGQFKKGLQHGTGVLLRKPANSLLKQEEIYDGQWMNGQKHGLGKYHYFKDTFYDGHWMRNKKQGHGTFKSPEGQYIGQWKSDMKEGRGILKLKNGNMFEGRWESDKLIQGRMVHSNGDSYEGQFLDSKRQGYGIYKYANKSMYKGYWQNNQKSSGEIMFFNGDNYHGDLHDNKFDGPNCRYKWSSGQQIYGEFHNDRPSKGKYRSPSEGQYQFNIK